jgi:hypothetical protein
VIASRLTSQGRTQRAGSSEAYGCFCRTEFPSFTCVHEGVRMHVQDAQQQACMHVALGISNVSCHVMPWPSNCVGGNVGDAMYVRTSMQCHGMQELQVMMPTLTRTPYHHLDCTYLLIRRDTIVRNRIETILCLVSGTSSWHVAAISRRAGRRAANI